jgi:hypothetical protein
MINVELDSAFDYIQLVLFDLGKYKQYFDISNSFKQYIEEIIPNIKFNYRERFMYIDDLIITVEI